MVMCSKRNTVNGTELHPSFNLKQTQNEWIILSNTLGNVIDSIRIVHLTQTDHSVGRSTDGAVDCHCEARTVECNRRAGW